MVFWQFKWTGKMPLKTLQLLLLVGFFSLCRGGYTPPSKYLIVSNARNGTVGYVKLSRSGSHSPVRTLIDRHLVHPQGIAVDQKRQLLLIADSELKKVVSYGLFVHEDGSLSVDEQTPVAEDVEARWVAVDGLGNVYMTDEDRSQVLMVSAQQVIDGDTEPRALYGQGVQSETELRSPGGIATDNFHVYWTNKEGGDTIGTVMKALQAPASRSNSTSQLDSAKPIAKNLPKAYGVCLALDNLFFTGPERHIYAVKTSRLDKDGGTNSDASIVSSDMENPRGCAWDGESTIFIADRSADGVFALPGPTWSMSQVSAHKVVHFEGAFGVAVFSGARHRLLTPLVLWVLVLGAAFASGIDETRPVTFA